MNQTSTAVSTPAVIRSFFPENSGYGRIPRTAQAAINNILSKRAASLLIYYMSEQDGFAPSAHEVYLYTGLEQPHMSSARKELCDRGFIRFDRAANTITILWDQIITMGKVAMMLAENPGCNVKETLKGGAFNFAHR